MKTNWLVTAGKVKIKDNTFEYIPEKTKGQYGEQIDTAAFIKSNIEFDNGDITFKVSIKEASGMCQVIFMNNVKNDINVGINTGAYLFGIIKYSYENQQWDLLSGSGSRENFDINEEYLIRISIYGSIITLYVNEIKVAEAIQEIRPSQIQFVFRSEKQIILKDFKVSEIKPKAFVVMQFSDEYNDLYKEVIKPVCEEFGLECERADDYFSTNMIIQDIVQSITSASVIIADITPDNPNVFYEVGYSHAINKPTILLCDRSRTKLPFDLSSFRTLFYENSISGKTRVENKLRKYLENIFYKN